MRALVRPNPNQHLLVRDDYPEVIHAEQYATSPMTYMVTDACEQSGIHTVSDGSLVLTI